MKKKRFCLIALIIIACLIPATRSSLATSNYLSLWTVLLSQAETTDDSKDAALAERFLKILERNPRRGTALDRAYGYYVESGKVDELISKFEERLAASDEDGTGWMVLGMLQSKRGNDEDAILSFSKAQEYRPDDAFASYYLGQSYALAGQIEEAAKSFEQAIERQPRKTDLLTIYQSLGRLYQRSQQAEKALEIWNRLEKEFPDDALVKEQIAFTLAEEGEREEALKRFQALIDDKATDLYRRVQYQIEAANLKVKLSQKSEAVADFENLLKRLKPGSWLHDQVRDKIEQVYRRDDDLAGLADYYESWVKKNADDVNAMSLLARVYSQMGRSAEARAWFAKAIEKAPSQSSLRQQFIDELVAAGNYRDAADEYRQLDKIDPNNPDNIQQWGLVVLKDKKKTEPERKKEAVEIWMKLVDSRKDDPVIITQIADLMRQSDMNDKAIELYQQAISLAPEKPQYREYLGQFYHQLERPEDAVDTWKEMAAGERRSSATLQRLAEVYSQFGYKQQAIEAIQAACASDPKDFARNLMLADFLSNDGRYDDALNQLEHTRTLASNDEEKEGVFDRQLEAYTLSGKLSNQIRKLEKAIAGNQDAQAEDWQKLARFLSAGNRRLDAIEAAEKAIELDPESIVGWRIAGELYESAGKLEQAADANRKLASLDRRFRTQYLTAVARLEASLGRIDAAMQAGTDLIAAAPGNTDNYQFFAGLCFRLGKTDDGLNALRRAMRANPTEPEHILSLADALAQQYKTHDAIDLYWQALTKTDELQPKLGIVGRMTELYLQVGEFDKLIERLERIRLRSTDSREATFLIAEAHLDAQNYVSSIEELESLLAKSERDTLLLRQLSVVAERSGDYDLALEYQKKLYSLAPDRSNKNRLAKLFLIAGDYESAEQMWTQILLSEDDFLQVLNSVDRLIGYQRFSTAELIISDLSRQKPGNWELLTRLTAIHGMQDEWEKTRDICDQILAMNFYDNEKSEKEKRAAAKRARGKSSQTGSASNAANNSGILGRSYAAYQVRQFTGIERSRSSASVTQSVWSPSDFGQARMAAIGWLYRSSQANPADFNKRFIDGEINNLTTRELWDQIYAAMVLQQPYTEHTYNISLKLRETGTVESHWMAFATMAYGPIGNAPNLLNDEQINSAIESYRIVSGKHPEWIEPYFLSNFITKLDRANRSELGNQLYSEAVEKASDFRQLTGFMSVAGARGDTEAIIKLIDRMVDEAKTNRVGMTMIRYIASYALNAIGKWEEKKNFEDIVRVHRLYLEKLRTSPEMYQAASLSSRTSSNSYSIYQMNGRRTSKSLSYPAPNIYYDLNAITILVNAYEFYKRHQKTDELFNSYQEQISQAEDKEKIQLHLTLSYLLAWDQKNKEAAEQLDLARHLDASNADLTFDFAQLHSMMGEFKSAIEILDKLEIADPKRQIEREKSVLAWAMKADDTERAKLAAKRLFGLRLDARYQVTLANNMQKLGLQDYAEAVLRRARRRSSNDLSQLVSIMNSYKSKGDTDIAVQVAHQILRRTAGRSSLPTSSSRSSSQQNEIKKANDAAMQLLKESGKLDELINRAEAQLERSPKSEKIMKTLAEYYAIIGKKNQSTELYMKIANLNPKDIKLRYQVATSIYSSNKVRGLEMITSIIEDEPNVFLQYNDDILKKYREQKQLGLLSKTLVKADIRNLASDPWRVQNLVNEMTRDKALKDDAIDLLDEFWDAFPKYRSYVFQSNNSIEFLKEDRVYNLFKKTVLEPQLGIRNQNWNYSNTIVEWGSNAGVQSILNRFVDVVAERDELADFTEKLTARMKTGSSWKDGHVLLAIANIRAGKVENGISITNALIADETAPIVGYAVLSIGTELEKKDETRQKAIAIYQASVASPKYQMAHNYNYSPAQRLVYLYKQNGSNLKARDVLLQFTEPKDPGYSQPRDLADYRLNRRMAIAKELMEFGFPFDAIRVYQKIIDSKSDLAVSSNAKNFVTEANSGMSKCSEKLTLDNVQVFVDEIASRAVDDQRKIVEIPLFTVTSGSNLKSLRVTSPMLAIALNIKKEQVEQYRELTESFQPIAKNPEASLSVRMLNAVLGWQYENEQATAESIVDRLTPLVSYLKSHPLEQIEQGKQPNNEQIEHARERFALFAIAEALLVHSESVSSDQRILHIATALSNNAVDAAEYLDDVQTQRAIYFRLGDLAAKQKNLKQAEAHWKRLLELILTRRISQMSYTSSVPDLNNLPYGSVVPVYKSSPVVVSPGITIVSTIQPNTASSIAVLQPTATSSILTATSPVSIQQCQLALELATLAAEHDLQDLSLECVSKAFQRGWPVTVANQPLVQPSRVSPSLSFTGSVPVARSARTTTVNAITPTLTNLVTIWRSKKFPEERIYESLADIVLPKNQVEQINLRQLQTSRPKSGGPKLIPFESTICNFLLSAAIKASKEDDLETRINKRSENNATQLQSRYLLGMLGTDVGNLKIVEEQLNWFEKRLGESKSNENQEFAAAVALKSLDTELAPKAFKILRTSVAQKYNKKPEDENSIEVTQPLMALVTSHLLDGTDENQPSFEPLMKLLDSILSGVTPRAGSEDAGTLKVDGFQDFHAPNPYLPASESQTLQFLINEMKKNDRIDDFVSHLKTMSDDQSRMNSDVYRFAYLFALWQSDDDSQKEKGLTQLNHWCEEHPQNTDLRILRLRAFWTLSRLIPYLDEIDRLPEELFSIKKADHRRNLVRFMFFAKPDEKLRAFFEQLRVHSTIDWHVLQVSLLNERYDSSASPNLDQSDQAEMDTPGFLQAAVKQKQVEDLLAKLEAANKDQKLDAEPVYWAVVAMVHLQNKTPNNAVSSLEKYVSILEKDTDYCHNPEAQTLIAMAMKQQETQALATRLKELVQKHVYQSVVLKPESVLSKEGKEFEISPNGDITLKGDKATKDEYEIITNIPDETVTALRLEIRNPGDKVRYTRITTLEVYQSTEGGDESWQQIKLKEAFASFEERGSAMGTIDENPKTYWRVTKTRGGVHSLIIKFPEPVSASRLKVVIKHNYGNSYTTKSFRLHAILDEFKTQEANAPIAQSSKLLGHWEKQDGTRCVILRSGNTYESFLAGPSAGKETRPWMVAKKEAKFEIADGAAKIEAKYANSEGSHPLEFNVEVNGFVMTQSESGEIPASRWVRID